MKAKIISYSLVLSLALLAQGAWAGDASDVKQENDKAVGGLVVGGAGALSFLAGHAVQQTSGSEVSTVRMIVNDNDAYRLRDPFSMRGGTLLKIAGIAAVAFGGYEAGQLLIYRPDVYSGEKKNEAEGFGQMNGAVQSAAKAAGALH